MKVIFELDLLSIWNLIFAGYTSSKNQVQKSSSKIKYKNQVQNTISWNADFKESITDR